MFYGANYEYDYGLFGLMFFDKAGNCILQAGDCTNKTVEEIVLEDDERVVGVVSRLNRGFPAYHQDVQFKIHKV
jgi:hypothetical protein